MIKVNITGDGMVFRKDFDGRAVYTTTLSKKNADGHYENAYMPIQFKKDVELADRTKIEIRNGWLTFYKNKEGKAVWKIFAMNFDILDGEKAPEGFAALDDNDCPF